MLLGIILLNTELNKPHFLRDVLIFIHCSLQIKQDIYSIGIFRAPVVTPFIEKVMIYYKEKMKKVPFMKAYHFYISQHFPIVKV